MGSFTRAAAVALLAWSAAVGAARGGGQAAPGDLTLQGRYTPRDQQLARYVYLPFDVPAGTGSLDLSYDYDRAGGLNTIDLGLYEPDGSPPAGRAQRGWSGGAQTHIHVGEVTSSPGYWTGPVREGRWQVVLGLYRIADAGVDVTVSVRIRPDDDRPAPPPAITEAPRRPATAGWYVGVLHAHTTHSDGALTPGALLAKARAEQLDFLAITDHNNTVHQRDLGGETPLVITGEEVTTPGGHFNVWGLSGDRDEVDFRFAPGSPELRRTLGALKARGLLVGINHPFSDCPACGWTHDVDPSIAALEIANGLPAERDKAIALWEVLLRSGRHVTAVGGTDWHREPARLDADAVRVWADGLSAGAVLDGIARGRVVVVSRAALPAPDFTLAAGPQRARIGDTLSVAPSAPVTIRVAADPAAFPRAEVDLFLNGELMHHATMDPRGTARLERAFPHDGYIRAVVRSGRDTAITNPIFLRPLR